MQSIKRQLEAVGRRGELASGAPGAQGAPGEAMVTLECECGFTCGTPAGLARHRARTRGEPVRAPSPPPHPPGSC